jgi:aminoglycoside phosphotransferase
MVKDILTRLPAHWSAPSVRVRKVELGETDAHVFRLVGSDGQILYAKAGFDAEREPTRMEFEKLVWLHARGAPVSPPLDHIAAADMFAFRTAGLVGLPGSEARLPRADLVRRAAETLNRLHATPCADWPFGSADAARLAEAGQNLARRRKKRMSPGKLARLHESLPSGSRSPVIVHGDADLANLVMSSSTGAFVDCGAAGLADPYLDLYVMADAVETRFGGVATKAFFTAYGIEEPDEDALAYYRGLDDFF